MQEDPLGEFRGSLLCLRLVVNSPPKILLFGTKEAYSFAPMRCCDGRFSELSDVCVDDRRSEDSGVYREAGISRHIRSRPLDFNKVKDVIRASRENRAGLPETFRPEQLMQFYDDCLLKCSGGHFCAA